MINLEMIYSQMSFNEIKNITADPNEIWAMWKKFFLDILKKHAPLTKIKFTIYRF